MSRIRYPNTDPLRAVTKANHRSGMMGLGMLGLKSRWWEMTLECGHTVERSMRYRKGAAGGTGWAALHHPASLDDALPAPKRARCPECGSAERESAAS